MVLCEIMLFFFSIVQDQLTILFGVLPSAVIVRFTNLYFLQAKFDLQPSVPVIIPVSLAAQAYDAAH